MKSLTVIFTILNFLLPVLCNFDLLILHNNDIHGRFEETEKNSGTCQSKNKNRTCVGGFARIAHEVRKYRKAAADQSGPEVLFLNAGDTFIGTVWYTVHTWNISSTFLNVISPDAQSLGNHEFDKGPDELVRFLQKVTFPTVTCNLNLSQEPTLQPYVKNYVVIEKAGRKIGIIGYLTPETVKISSPRNTIFLDEIEEIKKYSEILDSEGVKIIIALGHSGYLKDKEIAEKVPLVDIVIGGHTNTFLWNGAQPDTEAIEGPYPTMVKQPSGKVVPVVQAYAYTKYLGILNATFDENGDLLKSYGNPLLLDNSIPQDEDLLELLDVYSPAVNKVNLETVGTSNVLLDGNDIKCRRQECNFGNLIADAFVMYKATMSPVSWSDTPIGFMNGGGIRTSITPDDSKSISRGEILAALPFGNQVVSLKLKGEDLIKTLELGIRGNGETSGGEFLQVSGLLIVYDRSKPAMSRVVSVKTRCGNCDIPKYEDIDPTKIYSVVLIDFLANGNDGHYILKEKAFDVKNEDLADVDCISWYFQHYSPVFAEEQGRIKFVTKNVEASDAVLHQPFRFSVLFMIFSFLCIFQF
ncbi:protein 5NUC-like isoform X1 [Diorhabda sublineata]|uniref:protein 5NUC-like isoform X1 n=1 Tax=Diorhabda sublineata TaxID=1163346 RepID=UPI0024E15665|nr:protein 5NUC-like isoform X1 [Diorhabda sublineata]